MDDEFLNALKLLVDRDEAGELFDREADEGGYPSQELASSMAVIRDRLARLLAEQGGAAA